MRCTRETEMDSFSMTESERKEYQSVVLAGLLHDIGKLLHRRSEAAYKIGHHKASAVFIDAHESTFKNDGLYDLGLVRFLVLHHMSEDGEKKDAVLHDSNDAFLRASVADKERIWKLLTIVRDADLYSCAERDRDKDERKGFAYRLEPLRPIFQNIDLSPQGPSPKDDLNYRLSVLDPSQCFPETCDRLSDQEFGRLIGGFEEALPDFSRYSSFDDVINKWVDILQYWACNVPSDTRYDGPDVSLYDHSRSSAAFAACLYRRHLTSIRDNRQFERANEFILVGGDYSGIQDYIFHVTNRGSGGASKRLRARSFFVYLFCEATIHKILHALDLPFVCNLFSAGGKFLLLAPNIEGVADALQRTKTEIDTEISRTYFNQFSFLLSWMEINGYQTKSRPSELKIYSFYKSAEDMFHRLETEKLKKFSSILMDSNSKTWYPSAFKASEMYQQYTEAGDCKICGRGPGTKADVDFDTKETTMCCPICYRDKYDIGEALLKAKFIAFGKGPPGPGPENDNNRIKDCDAPIWTALHTTSSRQKEFLDE
jgi:CRISPR-associated protein Csm1